MDMSYGYDCFNDQHDRCLHDFSIVSVTITSVRAPQQSEKSLSFIVKTVSFCKSQKTNLTSRTTGST